MRRGLLYILLSIIACCIVAGTKVSAQERYETVIRHNAWNLGGGVAGLRLDEQSASFVEIYASTTDVTFKPTNASQDAWNFGAQLRSVYHLKRVSFAGGFGYDYMLGNKMCGSMFTEPWQYPFDILEFTAGRKNLETYSFTGGVSADVGHNILLGVAVDIAAKSYAKRKDLRHKNNALDFDIKPSLTWKFADGAIGATYIFRKTSEQITAGEYGISSENYYAFFDKGIGYGRRELWTGSGIHLKEAGVSGFPVRELTNGAMLQAQWRNIYADVTYRSSNGRSGEKHTVWHEFRSDALDAHIGLEFDKRWFVRATYGWYSQTNDENILTPVTENGVTIMRKFGSNEIFSRRRCDISAEAEYYTDTWDIIVGARHNRLNRLSTLAYPQYRSHSMDATSIFARATMRFGAFEIELSLSGAFGNSSAQAGITDKVEGAGDYPEQLTDYFVAETEWFTASRLGAGAGLRYNIRKFYGDLHGENTRAFDVKVLGKNRATVRLSAGYRF